MDAQTVTQQMVQAAQRELPGVWNRERVRRALVAALALIPDGAAPDTHVQARVHVHLAVDKQQMHAAVLAAAEQANAALPVTASGTLDLAELSLLVAATQPVADIRVPQLHPALDHPLILGGIAEIALRLDAARSTVAGWTKRAEKIGMPAPIAELAAGPVYDLTAVETWYRTWKTAGSGETIGDNGDGG